MVSKQARQLRGSFVTLGTNNLQIFAFSATTRNYKAFEKPIARKTPKVTKEAA